MKRTSDFLDPDMIMIKSTIREIIELTASEDDKGRVWGEDTDLGTMDELIEKAFIIIMKTYDKQ